MRLDYRSIDVRRLLEGLKISSTLEGEAWRACCPFHEEKSPSWTIVDAPGTDRNGLHQCFGCHAGGTAVELVKEVLDFGHFGSAVEWIEKHALGQAPVPLAVRVDFLPLVRRGFVMPRGVDYGPLEAWTPTPRRYAIKRGLTAAQVARWGIGYSVEGTLAGRLVIPTRNQQGEIGFYAARSFADHEAKYLSPNRWDNPDFGMVFGELHWPDVRRRKKSVLILNEGALNALAVERVVQGFYVGALSGSDVSPVAMLKLATWGGVVILTDNDPAGNLAADKLLGGLARHVPTRRVILPQGKDADSMVPSELAIALHGAHHMAREVAA